MPDIERKPAHLMVGLDGEPVRLVEKGAIVAGIYDVVEYVPASQLEGAVLTADHDEPLVPRPGWTLEDEYRALSAEFLKVEDNRDRLAEQLREVHLYAEKMMRDQDREIRKSGADLSQLVSGA